MAANLDGNGTPGVLAPPPLIYGVFLFVGLGLQYVWPVAVVPDTVRYVGGGGVIAASFVFVGFGLRAFVRARTTVNVYRSASALIVEGPFRINRNPIYTGMALVLVGIAFWIGALSAVAIALVFPFVITARFIRGEEAALRSAFGAEAEAYIARTRRW